MTVTAGIPKKRALEGEPVRVADGGRMVMRGALRLLGACLALAAVGLWFAPGTTTDGDIVLFKLVLSLAGVIAGLGLLQASLTPRRPEVEIDPIRREIRVVRRQPGAAPHVLQACSFRDLSSADFDGSVVRLWDEQNVMLAEVALPDGDIRRGLVAGLLDEGKLRI